MLKTIRDGSGNADIGLDADGDVPLRVGNASVFVRVFEDPLGVGVFSPILRDVETDDALLERINELNAAVFFARLFVVDGRVYAAREVLVAPFVPEHVWGACLRVGSLADEIGGTLRKEFGGTRAFEEEPEGGGAVGGAPLVRGC